MENIEQNICNCKENIHLKLEELLNEEKLLNKEIDTFEKKIETWFNQKFDTRPTSTPNMNQKLDSDSDLLPEVVAFDVGLIWLCCSTAILNFTLPF
jgi:hypothetical protein